MQYLLMCWISYAIVVELTAYVNKFSWDAAKYPLKLSLRNLSEIMGKQIGHIEADLKTKSSTYNNLKGSLQNLEKKQTYVITV